METIKVDAAPLTRDAVLFPSSPGWLAVRGVLALILGALAVLFPANALFAFTLLFAAYAAADGAVALVEAWRVRGEGGRYWPAALHGTVGLLVGALFIIAPYWSAISYAVVTLALLAAWCLAIGALEIAAAWRLRREIRGEWLLGLSGALSILLGLAVPVLLALNPAATMLSVAWVIGAYALALGVVLLFQAVRLVRRDDGLATGGRIATTPATA